MLFKALQTNRWAKRSIENMLIIKDNLYKKFHISINICKFYPSNSHVRITNSLSPVALLTDHRTK